jgi:hypothetical protein
MPKTGIAMRERHPVGGVEWGLDASGQSTEGKA